MVVDEFHYKTRFTGTMFIPIGIIYGKMNKSQDSAPANKKLG